MTQHNSSTPHFHVLDTTLRDGEQTPGVCFSPDDKLGIAQCLLEQVHVDRIEVASALVSRGEHEAASRIARWAHATARQARVEVLGYCDGTRSAEWIASTGLQRMNLLLKGSRLHAERQLGHSTEQHIEAARRTITSAAQLGVHVSGVWLEDWSRGFVECAEHVHALVVVLTSMGVRRFYLADTLGVLSPSSAARLVGRMCNEHRGVDFELHAHNDYGLATANCLSALEAGASGLHTTVNGLGERAGNADLCQVVVSARDLAGQRCGVRMEALPQASVLVERTAGRAVPRNAPVVGRDAFTHTAGVHADGNAKGDLYTSDLRPERFGRHTSYALGKLCGKASLRFHLERLQLQVPLARYSEVLARVVEHGEAKRPIGDALLARWALQAGGQRCEGGASLELLDRGENGRAPSREAGACSQAAAGK